MPTAPGSSITWARRFSGGQLCATSNGYSTFSQADSTGTRLNSWNTKPRCSTSRNAATSTVPVL